MPARVVDGEKIWKSEKIKSVYPASFRAEYTWLLPLAKGKEWFRVEPRYIRCKCYIYNRPDVSEENVADILSAFEKADLIEIKGNKGRWRPLDTETDEARRIFLNKQGGMCAICGTEDSGKRGFCVDHNHVTGKLRGALCGKCNRGIGLLQDNHEIVQKAADYLRKDFEDTNGRK